MPKKKNSEQTAPDLEAMLTELLSLRGDVYAKADGDPSSPRDSGAALAVFRLCRGLDLATWRSLAQRHDLRNWLTLPLGPEAYPHLSDIQYRLDALSYADPHDPVTGLDNRHSFEHGLDLEMERSRRAEAPVSLALVDLEGEALTQGEDGAVLLQAVAGIIHTLKRRYDLAAYLGHGRFALIFSGLGPTKARRILERLASAVHELSLPGGDGASAREAGISCYVGLTSYRGKSECELDRLMALADEALTRARGGESGRVEAVSSPDMDFGSRETLVLASEKQFLFKKG